MTQIVGIMTKKQTVIINGYEHISFVQPFHYTQEEMVNRSKEYHEWLEKRRSIRMFSDKAVPKSVIENLILSGSTAPRSSQTTLDVLCYFQQDSEIQN